MKKALFIILALSFSLKAQISQQWVAAYNGPSGSIDSVRNSVIDDAGNVYVTGSSTSSNVRDYTTLKYNPNGILLWEARYDGPSHNIDDAQWIAIDGLGNVYVTGNSRSGLSAGTTDFATVKYNSNGVEQWSARYDGPAGSSDLAVKVAVDNLGNVYVTGWSNGSGTSIDYATIKYNASGIMLWVSRYNGPGNSLDAPSGLAADGSGNVFVTGWSRSTSLAGSEDYLTIKYNSNGEEQWAVRHNGTGNFTDAAVWLAIDNLSNVFVTGHSYSTSSLSDYVTIKYNSAGAQQWLATYNNSATNGSDMPTALVLDNSGNVYVTGSSGTVYPLGYPNYTTVKYDPNGIQQWVAAYNGPGNGADVPYSIALDNYGNVCVTGKATMPGFFYDFATLKYSPAGVQLAELRFNGASNLQDGATWVSIDYAGNMYVTGNSMYFNDYSSDFVLIKYSMPGRTRIGANVTDLNKTSSGIPETFMLGQNYPNPFNPSTMINFGLPKNVSVEIKVYDLTGKEISTLFTGELAAGEYEIYFNSSDLSSGVYFYSLLTADIRIVKKMIVSK